MVPSFLLTSVPRSHHFEPAAWELVRLPVASSAGLLVYNCDVLNHIQFCSMIR